MANGDDDRRTRISPISSLSSPSHHLTTISPLPSHHLIILLSSPSSSHYHLTILSPSYHLIIITISSSHCHLTIINSSSAPEQSHPHSHLITLSLPSHHLTICLNRKNDLIIAHILNHQLQFPSIPNSTSFQSSVEKAKKVNSWTLNQPCEWGRTNKQTQPSHPPHRWPKQPSCAGYDNGTSLCSRLPLTFSTWRVCVCVDGKNNCVRLSLGQLQPGNRRLPDRRVLMTRSNPKRTNDRKERRTTCTTQVSTSPDIVWWTRWTLRVCVCDHRTQQPYPNVLSCRSSHSCFRIWRKRQPSNSPIHQEYATTRTEPLLHSDVKNHRIVTYKWDGKEEKFLSAIGKARSRSRRAQLSNRIVCRFKEPPSLLLMISILVSRCRISCCSIVLLALSWLAILSPLSDCPFLCFLFFPNKKQSRYKPKDTQESWPERRRRKGALWAISTRQPTNQPMRQQRHQASIR